MGLNIVYIKCNYRSVTVNGFSIDFWFGERSLGIGIYVDTESENIQGVRGAF